MASNAVVPAKELTQEEFNALLQGAGFASAPSERMARLKMDGAMLVTSDTGEMLVYNPRHPEIAAATLRIVKPLDDYMAIWLDDRIAKEFGRDDLANTFSKKYFQPDPDRRLWPSDEVYEDLARRNDILDDYNKPLKGSWKGDLIVQIVPESGQMTGEETQYILTLPTTSVMEFRGSSRAPEKGYVNDLNFMQKLSRFAVANAAEGVTPNQAVLNALTSYASGGVIAEVRPQRAENKERGNNWTVLVFDPIHIEPVGEGDNLLANPDEAGL